MEIASQNETFTLIGIPVGPTLYQLRAEHITGTAHDLEILIPQENFSDWLLKRGCEFCAYQVKQAKQVRCAHPPLTGADLAGLGFEEAALSEPLRS